MAPQSIVSLDVFAFFDTRESSWYFFAEICNAQGIKAAIYGPLLVSLVKILGHGKLTSLFTAIFKEKTFRWIAVADVLLFESRASGRLLKSTNTPQLDKTCNCPVEDTG